MSGTPEAPGIHGRTAHLLFDALAAAGDGEAAVEVAMLEIYCDQVRDLLASRVASGSTVATEGAASGGGGDAEAEQPAARRRSGSGSPVRLDVSAMGAGQLPRFQERVPGLAWVRVGGADEVLVRRCSASLRVAWFSHAQAQRCAATPACQAARNEIVDRTCRLRWSAAVRGARRTRRA